MQNVCAFSENGSSIATGGEDCVIRSFCKILDCGKINKIKQYK